MGHWYPRVPEDAVPGWYENYTTINPKEKYEHGKGLNFREQNNLDGVCEAGPLQLISCYRDVDERLCCEAFHLRCKDCPYYANQRSIWFDNRALNIMKPFFLRKWMKENELDYVDYDKDPLWHVYFISDTHYIKIGKSKIGAERIKTLQTGNPNPLTVLFTVNTRNERSAYEVESFLHNAFSDYRKEGEWFDILDKLQLNLWKFYFKED